MLRTLGLVALLPLLTLASPVSQVVATTDAPATPELARGVAGTTTTSIPSTAPGSKRILGNLLRCVAALLGEPMSVVTTSAGGHTVTLPAATARTSAAAERAVGLVVVPPAGRGEPAVLLRVPVGGGAAPAPFSLRTFGGPAGPYPNNPNNPNLEGPQNAGRYYHCDFLPSVMFFLSGEPRLPAYRCVSGSTQALVASEDFRAPYGTHEWIEEVDIQLSDDILSQIFPGSFHHVRGNEHHAVHGLEFKSPHVAINGLTVLNST